MTDLSDRLGRLSAEQRARFMHTIRDGAAAPQATAALRRREDGLRTPPSFQQEQMWFIDRLGGGQARNHIALSVRLDGHLDVGAVQRAVTTVVRRHDVLHSRLVEVDGRPVQERLPGHVPHVELVDLADVVDRPRALEDAIEANAAAAFDLAEEPPLRLRLFRLGPDAHVLLWVVHHIAWDPGSTAVFVEEFTACYTAFASGREPSLPDLAVRYSDVAVWQRERLTDERAAELRRFWADTLRGVGATEVLPDTPRTAETGGEGRGLSVRVPSHVLERVRHLADTQDTTVFAVLLAAFNAVLARWVRDDEVVVGTAAARRPHQDVRGMIGCFVEMIPLRTPVEHDEPFLRLVRRTRQAVLDAFAHAELPFEQVVDAVAPARDPLRHPLFQIEFTSLGQWGDQRREAGGVRIACEQRHDSAAKFDLSVLVGEVPVDDAVGEVADDPAVGEAAAHQNGTGPVGRDSAEIEISLEYNTALYRESTARTLLDAFARVLAQVADDPDVPVGALRLVSEDQAAQLTGPLSLGAPANGRALGTTLVDQFRTRVSVDPDAVAVRLGDQRVDFRTLDVWSDHVARRCAEHGVGRGDGVALRLTRGPSAVAAVLGVLKVGAFYVPIDRAAPEAYARTLVRDADVRLLLVDGVGDGVDDGIALDVDLGVPTLAISRQPAGHERTSPPPVAPEPSDLAYVLYTSGSTGTPKGVAVEHRSVAHFAAEIAAAYGIGADDTLVQYAPLTFDVSVFELFTAMLTGAELLVADDEARLDPNLLMPLLEDVTVAELPPALLPLLDPSRLPRLRLVSVGGEAFPGQLVGDWARDGRRFVNGYGPTETTVAVTLMDCVGQWDHNPPIGRPMVGHQALVLDDALRPVPPGAPGELCIAGPGVARGYLGRPELTAERFVANPYATSPTSARLYRTGDLVRWLPDGNLEFLGRTDRQLKLRGFRIEPGEVEAVLTSHPSVRQAVVDVVGDAASERQLVAYVVAADAADGAGGAAIDVDDVRRHVAERTPAHLVPVVVALDALPLTASGKIDRSALPVPTAPTSDSPVTGPRDEIEQQLVDGIVGPVLGHASLDVDADFFAAGGSSLQATTVVARVREQFDVDIALADFFRAPTVAGLAELVRAARQAEARDEERLLSILSQVEQMSDEEAAALLSSLDTDDPVGAGG